MVRAQSNLADVGLVAPLRVVELLVETAMRDRLAA